MFVEVNHLSKKEGLMKDDMFPVASQSGSGSFIAGPSQYLQSERNKVPSRSENGGIGRDKRNLSTGSHCELCRSLSAWPHLNAASV